MPKKQPRTHVNIENPTLVTKSDVPRTHIAEQHSEPSTASVTKPRTETVVRKTPKTRSSRAVPLHKSAQLKKAKKQKTSVQVFPAPTTAPSQLLQNATQVFLTILTQLKTQVLQLWRALTAQAPQANQQLSHSFTSLKKQATTQTAGLRKTVTRYTQQRWKNIKKWSNKKYTAGQKAAKKAWPAFRQRVTSAVLRIKTAIWTTLVSIASFIFNELLYPFYYIFRYHYIATTFSFTLMVLIFGGAYVTYDVAFRDLPSVGLIAQRQQLLTTKILDRNGKLLYRIYKDENRTLVPLSSVPENVKHATVAIEDRDFYTHHGISVRGIVRAVRENLRGGRIQGGSTITQQLVKNTLLTSEKTYKRKIREIILSFLVEQTYTKDEILEMYLNEVAYGGSTYGIEEASQRYFGKSARSLDLAESSFLAGLPQSPSQYSPFGSAPELATFRQAEVLRRMVEDGYITQQQADEARQKTLVFKSKSIDIQAPHFVMYVKNLLAQQYGEELVNQGGLEVRTTLDLDLHNKAQELVTKEMETLARLRISNGAALITNPKTGEIISMVGSKDYFDFAHDGQVNVTDRPRQPGSSIKPLTYALAFERGMTPSTTVVDEPSTFAIPGSAPYAPKNYDGRFHGNVSLRESLGSSYNIPAVKMLATVGISTMIDKAQEMGVTTWNDRNRFGLSLTLGGGEVKMTELAQIYGTFANEGSTTTLNPILEVKDAKGAELYRNNCAYDNTDCPTKKTLSTKSAFQITDVLTDNAARSPAFGPRSVLTIPGQQVAVKTGTTNSLRDNWTVGYTDDYVVAVWVGNNDNTPMSYVASGITGASPIWNKIIRLTLDDAKPHSFSTPEGMVRVKICVPTKTLACRGCPVIRNELFDVGTEPKTACSPSQFYRAPASPRPQSSPAPRDQILNGVTIGTP